MMVIIQLLQFSCAEVATYVVEGITVNRLYSTADARAYNLHVGSIIINIVIRGEIKMYFPLIVIDG